MDKDRIKGSAQQAKGKVKEKWAKLTEDDLDIIAGRRDRLEGKIQQRYGFAIDHIRKEVDDWVRWQVPVSARRSSRKSQLPLAPGH